MIDEWRPVDGFQHYEINRNGDIRSLSSGKTLIYVPGSNSRVRLRKFGETFVRAVEDLIKNAFPPADEKNLPLTLAPRKVIVVEARAIQEFPNYTITRTGEVKNMLTKQVLLHKKMSNSIVVQLSRNNVRYNRTISRLLANTYPEDLK